ncbi:MAG: HAMP domain-containing histidine kinase [Gemmatimonadota bacterium]|jgi:two-component system sensor histidine kinase ChiS|nr:HAMP domain-containing histidine kinase [Gemmatimonadota bacterium]
MIRLHLPVDRAQDEALRLRDLLEQEGFIVNEDHSEADSPGLIVRPAEEFLAGARQVEELKAALRELRNLDVAKSQFLANISHDLRTPLTAIITYGEVLRDGILGEMNPRQSDAVESVISTSRQMLVMIEGILTYVRAGARAIELDLTEFPITGAIDLALRMCSSLIRKKGLVLESLIEPELPLAWADQDKIVHVLTNLLGNAIEFTPRNTGTIRITARRSDNDPAWLVVSVQDNGIGIDPGNHELIFREFSQVDSSTAREYHGTGLGLPISRNFISLHGGEIGVQSEIGKGSLFWFTLPSVEVRS